MQLCSVEHMLNTSLTFFSSKLDSPVIKTLERIRFFSNQNIGEGESNFDEKNVEEVFNLCSICVQLVRVSSFRNDLLQNPYFSHSPVSGFLCEIAIPLAWTFPDKLAEIKKWWLTIKSKFESVKGKKLSDVLIYLSISP